MDFSWIIEINIFCILILSIILYSLQKNYDRQTKQRYYVRSIISGIIAFLCEINWSLIEMGILPEPRICNYLTNSTYIITTTLMGYFWLCYVELSLESKVLTHRHLKFYSKLPVGIIVTLVVISYFNGMLFYIDESNHYHRGNFIFLHVVLCHLYTFFTSIHALTRSLKTKIYLKSLEYRVLAMFLFFPLGLGLIQIFVPNIPSISVGITLAFLFVYIDLQNLQISIDTLSGLNNRNQLLRYLGPKLRNDNEKTKVYVFMIDVNKFKKINDTYGHVEGDMALIRCSKALKNVNKTSNNFIGRYGGDEFIIISDQENDDKADELCKKIHASLAKICKEENVAYDLSFSIGYSSYNPQIKSVQEFIASADKKLYEAKKKLNQNQ